MLKQHLVRLVHRHVMVNIQILHVRLLVRRVQVVPAGGLVQRRVLQPAVRRGIIWIMAHVRHVTVDIPLQMV